MKTLVCANQKGGVGKTTLLVHLAFYFGEQGKKTAVIDVDHQMNASYTLSKYSVGVTSSQAFMDPETSGRKIAETIVGKGGDNIFLIEADATLLSLDERKAEGLAKSLTVIIKALADSGIDIVLIDTPPALVPRFAAALMVADNVISPIELEIYSLQGIQKMLTAIRNVRDKSNTKLNFLGMLPSRVVNTNPRHAEHLKELEAKYKSLLIPLSVSQRGSIADAVSEKIPVWKIKKTAARVAAKEMKALGEYVLAKLGE
jgi:chromosome partitioning protein